MSFSDDRQAAEAHPAYYIIICSRPRPKEICLTQTSVIKTVQTGQPSSWGDRVLLLHNDAVFMLMIRTRAFGVPAECQCNFQLARVGACTDYTNNRELTES